MEKHIQTPSNLLQYKIQTSCFHLQSTGFRNQIIRRSIVRDCRGLFTDVFVTAAMNGAVAGGRQYSGDTGSDN